MNLGIKGIITKPHYYLQAEGHLPPNEPEDSKLKIEFRTQIERLRSKLQQIAGADALIKFDRDRQGEAYTTCRPNEDGGDGDGDGGGGGVATAFAGRCLWCCHCPCILHDFSPCVCRTSRISNEQLAHELLLDPNYKLDYNNHGDTTNTALHRIRESFELAFWSSLADDFRLDPPCYFRALRVLAEIRDGISELATRGSEINHRITQVLDIDFIKQQIDNRAFDLQACKNTVLAVIDIIKDMQVNDSHLL